MHTNSTLAPQPPRRAATLGLRLRIGIGFAVLALLVFTAVGWVSGQQARQQIQQDVANALAQLATHVASDLDVGMHERWREIQNLAFQPGADSEQQDPARWRATLDRLQASNPHYTWLGLADASGRVLAASGGLLEGQNVSARPWFKAGLSAPFVGDVHEALMLARLLPPAPGGEPLRLVDFAVPLRSNGRVTAVLGAHLNWRWADERRGAALAATAAADGVDILVLDTHGRVLLGPTSPAPPLADLPALLAQGPAALSWGAAASASERYFSAALRSPGYKTYAGLGWTVLVRQPEAQALRRAAALEQRIWLTGGVGALLFGLAGWWLAGGLTARLRAAARVAQQLGGGPQAPAAGDEVAQLAGALLRLQSRASTLVDSNAELQAFSRSVSHDLKGPIGSIGMVLQQMLHDANEPLGPRAQRALGIVVAECERLVQLVDELLALAMVEQHPLERVPVNMDHLLHEVLTQLRPLAGTAHFDIQPLPPASGDALLLQQVLQNLVGNAVKYSSRVAQPQIRVDGHSADGEAVYRVQDNGAGFEMAQGERLFQAFQRLHRPSDFPGTGVGLSIVRRAVQRHGGRVWVERAAPGAGATFCFALPLAG
jgi:signal transduction histidine kinase